MWQLANFLVTLCIATFPFIRGTANRIIPNIMIITVGRCIYLSVTKPIKRSCLDIVLHWTKHWSPSAKMCFRHYSFPLVVLHSNHKEILCPHVQRVIWGTRERPWVSSRSRSWSSCAGTWRWPAPCSAALRQRSSGPCSPTASNTDLCLEHPPFSVSSSRGE